MDEILANLESENELMDEIYLEYDDNGMYSLLFLYDVYASHFTYIYKYIT
jgi:hypothetical protein